ncbi:unnamed protein product [Prunus armeniaca]
MDQFIQQDLFGSDQEEWDWSDPSLRCKTPAADRCPMSHFMNSYARELMNCDIAPNQPQLYSRLGSFIRALLGHPVGRCV